MNFKILISICIVAVLISVFQNCGSPKSAVTSGRTIDSGSLIVKPLNKSVASVVIDVASRFSVEIRRDGSVVETPSGQEVALDPALNAKIQNFLADAQLCEFTFPPPSPETVTCMAFPMPYAVAITSRGENVEVAVPKCQVATVDICPANEARFHILAEEIRQAVQAP